MAAKLTRGDGKLIVKLAGDKQEFADQLVKVKAIPGRRYNPDDRTWELPDDLDTLLKAVGTLAPDVGVDIQDEIKASKAKIAEELVTVLPDDAALTVPWASDLAPKQRAGIDFLAEHPHSLLADEMGAGKTVQAISAVYERAWRTDDITAQHPAVLVVCPNSVTGVWVRELEKWLNEPATVIDAKTPAKRVTQFEEAHDWVIVNWEKLRLMPELAKRDWDAVIADEAHRAKNRKAQQTKALWKLKAPIQLALTGTPLMNSPDELWSVLRWLRPEQYTSYWAFYYTYVDYYEGGFQGRRKIVTGVKNADSLRFELADKMVRRTKREIHADIPEKLPPQFIPCPMPPKQARLYKEAEEALWLEVEQALEADPELAKRMSPSDLEDPERLQLLIPNTAARNTRLRQIATSPALLGGEDVSGKLDAAVEIITDNRDKPFVVFSWYKDTSKILVERLRKAKVSAESFTGDTPADQREGLAQSFQAGDFDVICCGIAAGGTGIDLFRADTVIFVEQDWVPAINDQAVDRLHRKGQKNDVSTLVLQSPGTIDTKRLQPKLRLKELIVSSVLGAKE